MTLHSLFCAPVVFSCQGGPAHARRRFGWTSCIGHGAALALLSLTACSPDLRRAPNAGQAQRVGSAMAAPADIPAAPPLTDRVILVRTQSHEAAQTALVRIDGAPPRPLLVGQAVAGLGVVEQITSRAIAIREGALVYVIPITPAVTPDSPAVATAQ